MDLLLWRHAEAQEGKDDLARPLTERGTKQALHVAHWLSKNAPNNLRIIVSPARRCQQTAEALGLPFETDARLGTTCDVAQLLAAVDWPHPDGKFAVLVIGHQPTLGKTAALLLSGEEAAWTIKKGAVWWFTNRTRQGDTQTILRSVTSPDYK